RRSRSTARSTPLRAGPRTGFRQAAHTPPSASRYTPLYPGLYFSLSYGCTSRQSTSLKGLRWGIPRQILSLGFVVFLMIYKVFIILQYERTGQVKVVPIWHLIAE